MKPCTIKQSTLFLWVFALFLVACGGNMLGDDLGEADPDTGLPVNPTVIPNQEFIVEGTIISLTLIPQTAPEFVVQAPAGRTYRIRSQALSAIFYEDGEVILPRDFRQGMSVRATVQPASGVTGSGTAVSLISEDLTILRPPEE